MPADFLLELGTEELPASFLSPALDDLSKALTAGFEAQRLSHGAVERFATPRRVAILIRAVADRSPDVTKQVQGPSVRAAKDASGQPTQALLKFAASVGTAPEALKTVTTPKGEYLSATVEEKGRPALAIITELLPAVVKGLNFKKSMRWGDVEASFGRPLHWIVALLGAEIVPLIFADVRSGRVTRGHRFLANRAIELATPGAYEVALEAAHVVPSISKRRALVVERVRSCAKAKGGFLFEDEGLVDQVTNLVESPHPVMGTFDSRHLDLPREVLISEMKNHQRYFAVVDAKGGLLPQFVAVSNTPVSNEALSIKGYERVLRSRLSDGRFFFDEDRRARLETRLPRLERVVWQGALGSYGDKISRIEVLADWLANATGNKAAGLTVSRVARLCKADLVTGMVGEFPELQGVMGREYAKHDGEPEAVSLGIFEHYLPRGAGDQLPTGPAGALVGLADRFDSLVGIFAIGKAPTGAADPFALRRACLGIINVTQHLKLRFSLKGAVQQAYAAHLNSKLGAVAKKQSPAESEAAVLEFFRGRLKAGLAETAPTDVVEAVLAAGFDDIVAVAERVKALKELQSHAEFPALMAAFKRVANIVQKQGKDVAAGAVERSLLKDAAELSLFDVSAKVGPEARSAFSSGQWSTGLHQLIALKPAVDRFFEEVMVMADDPGVRANRLRLLSGVQSVFGEVADFGLLQTEGARQSP